MDYYVLHARTLNHMFDPFDMEDVREVVHDTDEDLDPDDERITHTQEVSAFTHEDDECYDDIEERH